LPFADTGSGFGDGFAHAGPERPYFIVTCSDSLFLFDWTRERAFGRIPIFGNHTIGDEHESAILTAGEGDLMSWPIQKNAETGSMRLGPPQVLIKGSVYSYCGASSNGDVLAIPQKGGGTLVWHRKEDRRLTLDLGVNARFAAVSPDGCWVATCNGYGAKAWDARTGRAERHFPVDGLCAARFSPDSRWLVTTGGGFRLWKVGTWEEGPDLHDEADYGRWCAFSPDSKILALSGRIGEVRLLETGTGREFARLTVPEQTRVRPTCFSPDGTKLAAVGTESQLLYNWDLRLLRSGLREFDLDSEQPAFPPAGPTQPGPLQVKVDLGDLAMRAKKVP
jgi:hypothetical protein